MSWKITVVPDTFPALHQAGITIPGQEYPKPPAQQLAVLDSYSRDNNSGEAIAADLSHQAVPKLTAREADNDLQAVTRYYGAADPAHAVAIAIEQRGHLTVKPAGECRPPLWEPLSSPALVQTGLKSIAAGLAYRQHYNTSDLLLDFLEVDGKGAAVRRAHELGYRVVAPQRAVFALPARAHRGAQSVVVSAKEKALLQARLDHASEEETVTALGRLGIVLNLHQVKRRLAALRDEIRFDTQTTTELLTKAVMLGVLPAEREAESEIPASLQTPHRLQVLAYAACGLSNVAIGPRVGLSEQSVRSSLKVGFKLLGGIGREQLMHAGIRAGIFVVGKFVEA